MSASIFELSDIDITEAETILAQLGGKEALRAMIGADKFGYASSFVTFSYKGSMLNNRVKISLDINGNYTVEFFLFWRTGKCTLDCNDFHIPGDQLRRVFEENTGLMLHVPAIVFVR